MTECGFAVKGIDVSGTMLGIARKNHPEVEFELVDVCFWDDKGSYDLIVAWIAYSTFPWQVMNRS